MMANEEQGQRPETVPARPQKFWRLTLATALAFVFLVSLGVWQLQRLAWKQGLIDEIEARQTAEPISLNEALKMRRAGEDVRYLRVRATGTFLHNDERYFYAPDAKLGPGFDIYTPFQVAGGEGLIIVNRGFVPEPLKVRDARRAGQIQGQHDVIGLVRLPGRSGAFTPDNNADKNLWFWRDFDAMAMNLRDTATGGASASPKLGLFLDAEQAAPGGWPRGGVRKIELSNRHFGYALTWFGLAATLIGVYAAMMWGRRHR